MALRKGTPPPHVIQAYKAGLADFIDPGDPLGLVFLEAHPGQHEAHQVFSLGLADIGQDGSGISRARPVGWRFVAANEASDLAGACHISESPGAPSKFTGLSRVSKLADVFKLIRQFETLDDVHQKAQAPEIYDLVVLRIPGLVEAFWVKSRSSQHDQDLVVPFYTQGPIKTLDPKNNLQAFPMTEFLREYIFGIAQQRLGFRAEEGWNVQPGAETAGSSPGAANSRPGAGAANRGNARAKANQTKKKKTNKTPARTSPKPKKQP